MNNRIVWLLLIFTPSLMAQKVDRNEKIKFLVLGDSYTIGESVAEDQRWPVQLMKAFEQEGYSVEPPTIIATTGWRTDDLKKAILPLKPPHDYTLVSLLIGVNNQYQGKPVARYALEFEELLLMAISHAGGDKSKVFVVSIPDYGFTPFGKEKQSAISNALNEFNHVNKSITEKNGVRYFNITDISRQGLEDTTLVADDGLHPSGKMYGQWVKLMAEDLISGAATK
jgi:lysophospholipase L1-like esterase